MAPASLIGTSPERTVPHEAIGQVLLLMDEAAATGESRQVAADMEGSASNWRGNFDITVAPMPDRRVVVTWRDATDAHATKRHLRAAYAAATHTATHDPLTNLPNSVLLNDRLESAMAALSRTQDWLAVILVDLDSFHRVNDRFGHLTGDLALVQVAERLSALTRGGDTVARMGDDTFAILVTAVDSTWEPLAFHERLTAALGSPFDIGTHQVTVSTCVGVAMVERPGDVAAETDQAGRGGPAAQPVARPRLADDLPSGPGGRRLRIGASLAPSWPTPSPTSRFFLVYQPVVDVRTGVIVGQEALLRWRHPTRGVLSPAHFLDVAETSGMIVEIGDWVIRQVIEDLVTIPGDRWASLNLAPAQILRSDLATTVATTLAASGVAATRLVLEITESQMLEGTPAVMQRIEDLRALGAHISLDDFGSGFSSLAYLQSFPLDIVKLDQEIIAGDVTEPKARLLAWMSHLPATIDAQMIVEGVETVEQLELVRDAGLRLVQGYLLARPVELAEVPESITLPTVYLPRPGRRWRLRREDELAVDAARGHRLECLTRPRHRQHHVDHRAHARAHQQVGKVAQLLPGPHGGADDAQLEEEDAVQVRGRIRP